MKAVSECKPRHVWPTEHIALLGTMSDEDVAKAIGVTKNVVFYKRNELNIKAFKPKVSPVKGRPRANFEWTEDKIALLGTVADRHLADKFGLANNTVARKRRALNIDGQYSKHNRLTVSPALAEKLKVYSDKTIAIELGVSVDTVRRKRKKIGIPPQAGRKYLPAEANVLLGKNTDTAIASKYGVSEECVRNRRVSLNIVRFNPHTPLPQEVIEQLGKVSDAELARMHSLNYDKIRQARIKRCIDAYRECPIGLLIKADGMLGKETDTSIARRLGIKTKKVRSERLKLGIKTFNPKRSNG